VQLSWSEAPITLSYNVKRSRIGGGPYAIITDVATTACADTTAAHKPKKAGPCLSQGTAFCKLPKQPAGYDRRRMIPRQPSPRRITAPVAGSGIGDSNNWFGPSALSEILTSSIYP